MSFSVHRMSPSLPLVSSSRHWTNLSIPAFVCHLLWISLFFTLTPSLQVGVARVFRLVKNISSEKKIWILKTRAIRTKTVPTSRRKAQDFRSHFFFFAKKCDFVHFFGLRTVFLIFSIRRWHGISKLSRFFFWKNVAPKRMKSLKHMHTYARIHHTKEPPFSSVYYVATGPKVYVLLRKWWESWATVPRHL